MPGSTTLPLPKPASHAPRPGVVSLWWLVLPLAAWLLSARLPHAWALAGAPVVEELLFREGLQRALARRLAAAPAGLPNLLTALAFASAHLIARPGLASALTLLPALAIGRLYQARPQVLPCIGLHALFNAMGLALLPALASLLPWLSLPSIAP